jgi:hypothetical protein
MTNMNTSTTGARRSSTTDSANADAVGLARALDRLEAYDLALRALERDYPMLDPDSDVFDEEIMLSVCEWMKSLVRQGADPVLALTTATFDLLGPRRVH